MMSIFETIIKLFEPDPLRLFETMAMVNHVLLKDHERLSLLGL